MHTLYTAFMCTHTMYYIYVYILHLCIHTLCGTRGRAGTHIHAHTCTHARTHTHTYTHTHTHKERERDGGDIQGGLHKGLLHDDVTRLYDDVTRLYDDVISQYCRKHKGAEHVDYMMM